MKKNEKQKLFEMMSKLDSSFKINERYGSKFDFEDLYQDEPSDGNLEVKKEEARRISAEEGVAQHVNMVSNGVYEVSDFFDADNTVYSYENGRELNEDVDLGTPSTRGIRSGEGRIKKMFFNHVLDGHEATEENAYNAARGLDWQEIETTEGDYPYLDYIDTVNGVGIWYNYGHDAYYFSDESGEGESWKYIEENINENNNREKIIDMIIQAGLDLANEQISQEEHDRKVKNLENILRNMSKK